MTVTWVEIHLGHLKAAEKRLARLEADLAECLEFLERQCDVVDGSYGEPRPNKAMQLCSMIKCTLFGEGNF